MTEQNSEILPPSDDSSDKKTDLAIWSPAEEKTFSGATIDARKTASSGFRRGRAKLVAIALIAAGIGAAGGSLASEGAQAWLAGASPDKTAMLADDIRELKNSLQGFKSDLASLKSATDQVIKASSSQAGKIGDRLERIEKAQAEPAAKIAKLSETVEKLKAQPVPAPEVTGSVPAAPPKPPIVPGWTLRDVQRGVALVEGPQGLFDVEPGDPLPGLIRVEAVRRENGRWVVVTSKGWIVTR